MYILANSCLVQGSCSFFLFVFFNFLNFFFKTKVKPTPHLTYSRGKSYVFLYMSTRRLNWVGMNGLSWVQNIWGQNISGHEMAGNLTVTKKKHIVSGRIMIHDGFGIEITILKVTILQLKSVILIITHSLFYEKKIV